MVRKEDRAILVNLAKRWRELSELPVIEERKKLWTSLKDLKPIRPMILIETLYIRDYVADGELLCEDPYLRSIERRMRWTIRHAEDIGDDLVVEPCFSIEWDVHLSDYGVKIACHHASDSVAYSFANPIHRAEDVLKLKPRTFFADRVNTIEKRNLLEDIFGDILPVVIRGSEYIIPALTQDLFKLLGAENMMLWIYDEPEALHKIMSYLLEQRKTEYNWLETQKLIEFNNTNQLIGSGSPGYMSTLPRTTGNNDPVHLKDLWLWMESQETANISPQHFKEFFLPYMAELCRDFGLVYYGCCEPLHDRWEYISSMIPNIRAVSISPWSDVDKMAEMLGKNYVFSRKPNPAYISGTNAEWDLLRNDVKNTIEAANGCNLEFIFRDIYDINGEGGRLKKWVEMVRAAI